MASHHFGPAKGASRVRRHDLTVNHAGQRYRASYEIENGQVVVSSAYGSRAAPAGAAPETAALRVFTALLAERAGTAG